MDPPAWQTVLKQLGQSPWQIAIAVSGGGAGTLAKCFRRPGASRTFVEAAVPYARFAMADYLGEPPVGPSASDATAEQAARRAWQRCRKFADAATSEARFAGIALTAALPTTTPRPTPDRIHVAVCCDGPQAGQPRCHIESRELESGKFTRQSAEDVADQMMLEALASLLR
jgi:hypothetical protein